MKRTISIVFMLLISSNIFGQQLLQSRHDSYYTYIYKLTASEVEKLYKQGLYEIDESYLHTVVDSFPTDSEYTRQLPAGYYLQAFVTGAQWYFEFTAVQSIQVFTLNNSTDLNIGVYDSLGRVISNAEVKIRLTNLRFDKKTQTYRLRKTNKKGLLKVTHNNITTYYQLNRDYYNPSIKRVSQKVIYKTPLKFAWIPVKFVVRLPIDAVRSIFQGYPYRTIYSITRFGRSIYERLICLFDKSSCNNYRFTRKHAGYLVLNKPKYKPGDTIKWKAFVLKNGHPVNKKLDLILKKSWGTRIELGTITPYCAGGYSGEFTIPDSLDLTLDQNYPIALELKEYHEVINEMFRYEEYELKKNKFEIRKPESDHYRGIPYNFYAKCTDENNMNLLDARLNIVVTSSDVQQFYAKSAFVKDTLWVTKIPVEATGETEILIPDSIMPQVNMEYKVEISLLTSYNELTTKKEEVTFYQNHQAVEQTLRNDSLLFEFVENGIRKPQQAVINAYDSFDNLLITEEVHLPYSTVINRMVNYYKVKTGSLTHTLKLDDELPLLQVQSVRTADSLRVLVDNPRNIPFNYFIYRSNKELHRGHATTLDYTRKVSTRKKYFIAVQYVWAGRVKTDNYEIPFNKSYLEVKLKQPPVVYPGQEVDVSIAVNDYRGKPVSGVDLTAFSLTKKFEYFPPNVPNLAKPQKGKNVINKFGINRKKLQPETKTLYYDYPKYNSVHSLDTIEYFKFLHPGTSIYKFSFPSPDSITQFAPYVVHKGNIEPVYTIYLDSKPLYFGWITNNAPYSFRVESGYHNLRIRTKNKFITMDSVYFKPRHKLIFSLEDTLKYKKVWISDVSNEFTEYETANIDRYIMPYRQDFDEQMAYIKQDNNVFLLNSSSLAYFRNEGFIAPIFPRAVEFNMVDSFKLKFEHEPGFQYEFLPQLLKMRSISHSKDYRINLNYKSPNAQKLSDFVMTEDRIKAYWQQYLNEKRYSKARYDLPDETLSGCGTMQIKYELSKGKLRTNPLNILLFKCDDASFIRVYPGNTSKFYNLQSGFYKILFFFSDEQYHYTDSLFIKVNGLNYYKIEQPQELLKDSFSVKVAEIIEKSLFNPRYVQYKELDNIYKLYQQQFTYQGAGRVVSGYVTDSEIRETLPGVAVLVKGTTYGTVADMNGYYSIKVPDFATELQFMFVGFKTLEKSIGMETQIDVQLIAEELHLEEVVVVGYGLGSWNEFVGSELLLNHQVLSLVTGANTFQWTVTNATTAGATDDIRIRGMSSLSGENKPLFIVDGAVYGGDISELDERTISSAEVLKDTNLTAIYGSRAANGVVIITTKNSSQKQNKGAVFDDDFLAAASEASSIRSNFSDYGYWQPRLTTDANGIAKFKVKFPDDITNWHTFVLAMNGKKQSGQTSGETKSFKPIMGQLTAPRFMITGDTAYAIGKALNYTSDTIQLSTKFELNGTVKFDRNQSCVNSIIDTLQVVAATTDTVKAVYSIHKTDGYFDGEKREIPVYDKGMEETTGRFLIAGSDTTVTLDFNPDLGEVTFYTSVAPIDILLNEAEYTINYRYACNEQLASKLKSLLAKKWILAYKKEKFRDDKEINSIIKRLTKNGNNSGLWGWWNKSETSYWISLHVLDALLYARREGYSVDIEKNKIENQFIWELESNVCRNKIEILRIALSLGLKFDYIKYFAQLEKETFSTLKERLELAELRQLAGQTFSRDSVLKYCRTTIFGNLFFEDSIKNNCVYDNTTITTLLAYRILRRDSINMDTLNRIRNYFFERKQHGYWRNTYESALIVETILPDFIKNGKTYQSPGIKLSGAISATISQFPYSVKFKPEKALTVTTSASAPIYITTYQTRWNTAPKPKSDVFNIQSHYATSDSSNTLHAGKPVELKVVVTMKNDAEYVRIEVPIPAGCSYNNKTTSGNYEAHREYFDNRVSIFCGYLPKGNHTFTVDLLPRYTGTYTLNPAKVDLMYFPVFYGNTSLKQTKIIN